MLNAFFDEMRLGSPRRGVQLILMLASVICFRLSAGAANNPPSIGPIPDQTVIEDQPTSAFRLTLSDPETPETALQLSGSSSDMTVVPPENIFFGIANGHRYVTVTPAFGRASGTSTISVTVSDGTNSATTNFQVTVNPPPPAWARFYNSASVYIPNSGAATPYPSQVEVEGRGGNITNMTLTLSKFSHERVQDVSMLLVSPGGQGVIIFSHISGSNRGATNVTTHLTDASHFPLPSDFSLWSEPLKPTCYAPTPSFPGAPAGPYGLAFTNFNGLNANGTWSLYIYDEAEPAGGIIRDGWSLIIATDGGGPLPPQISHIPNQMISTDTTAGPIPFTMSDPDSPQEGLAIATNSSNTALIPLENITLAGAGLTRTIAVKPASGQTGTAIITVSVTDGVNTANERFQVIVADHISPETAPDGTGTVLAAQSVLIGRSMTAYSVARDINENFVANVPADEWSLTNVEGGLLDTDVVPGPDRTKATFTPHAVGSVQIHVAAGGLTSVNSGTLTILPDTPPTISKIPDKTSLPGVPVGPFLFTVADVETPPSGLTVAGSSSNQLLVPDSSLLFYNLGGNDRTLAMTPAPGQIGNATITVSVNDGFNISSTNFVLTIGATDQNTAMFTNTNALTIPNQSVADVYPSINHVSGLPGLISKVILLLNDLNHTATYDLELLLVGPEGQKAVLFSHAWGGAANHITVGLDDAADYPLAVSPNLILTGTYQPADYGHDVFPAPAPGEAYSNTLAAFNATSPNGDWSLYVMNDPVGTGAGTIAGGWTLGMTVQPPPRILSISGAGTTNVVITWTAVGNLTYRVQSHSNFSGTGWTDLTPDVTATNTTATFSDRPDDSDPRFYRVVLLP